MGDGRGCAWRRGAAADTARVVRGRGGGRLFAGAENGRADRGGGLVHGPGGGARGESGTDGAAFTGPVSASELSLGNDLAIAHGGTGASSASAARGNLGLGTMALQASNAVAITGGAASGLTSLGVVGNADVGGAYRVDGVKVVGNRATGWAAATGTSSRSAFDAGTVTVGQLAQRLKALIDDLITHGLIGPT
jgi:hypothetical protein